MSNESNKLIPEATNRKPTRLIVAIPVDIAIAVKQVAVPGMARTALRRTPPATAVANAAERSKAETGTARKTGEAAFVGSICIWAWPILCTHTFHFPPATASPPK